MAGRWFRFDADFFDHHKALAVSLAARGLFVASIGYCWRHETDGWIPAAVIRRLADDPDVDHDALATQLITAGLWERDGANYRVHDYLDHQPSSEQRAAEREGARNRQRRSRERRHADVTPSVTRDTENLSQTEAPDEPPPPPRNRAIRRGAESAGSDTETPPVNSAIHNPQVSDHVDSHADVTRDSSVGHMTSQRKKTVEDKRRRDRKEQLQQHVAPTLNGLPPASPPARPHPADIRAVFDAWKQATGKTGRTVLSPKRRKAIVDALRDYPLDEVLDAVRGWRYDPWPERPHHNDLPVLLRNVEKFRDLARDGPPVTLDKHTRQIRDTYQAMTRMDPGLNGGESFALGRMGHDRRPPQRELPRPEDRAADRP